MHLAVLGSRDSWYLKDLLRAADGRHRISPATFSDLRSSMSRGQVQVASLDVDLMNLDCTLVRSMPPGTLEQVVFRMNALAQLEAAGRLVVNPPRSMEIAIDKYLATARLVAAGFVVPSVVACQTAEDALCAFEELDRDVVIKPLFGSEGRGITRVTDEAIMLRAAKTLAGLGAVFYLQSYVEHEGADLRLLVVGEQVFGMRRRNPLDWRTNVSRGAATEPLEVTPELREMAIRAASAVGAPLAGVDFLPGRDGVLYALEVNAVPGWKALARTLEVDVAAIVLDWIEERLEA